MTPVRIEKSFTRVLNALAELEALSSIDAFPGASAWVARLETRLERYLLISARFAADQPQNDASLIRVLLGRVKNAIAQGQASSVFSAATDLRDQVAAHFRALQNSQHGAAP